MVTFIKNIKKQYPIAVTLITFAVLAIGFYILSLFLIGATASEGRFYFPWLKYINYVDGLRISINKTSAFILNGLGYPVTASSKELLQIAYRSTVFLAYSCAGFGVMGVWAAFVITAGGKWQHLITTLIIGLFILWLINVARITLLILFNYHQWPHILPFDHHTNFNIVSYIVMLLMVRRFSKGKL